MNKARILHGWGGFTLVEVLVTILVLSLGVLAVAGLQVTTVRAARSAYFATQAVTLAQQMIDAMRANRATALHSRGYESGFSDRASCNARSTVAACDLATWKAALLERLPQGRGKVSVSAEDVVSICVRWRRPRGSRVIATTATICTEGLSGYRQFELETVL